MLVKRHLKLDANERRRQLELWNKRTFDERALMQLQGKEKAQGKEKEFNVGSSFVHELAEGPRKIAFACGGVFSGTLHAHGALIKTHQVSYSVGAAGKYLMHVGLRQQSVVLPGSPFALEVKPGPAHAPSTKFPEDVLPLQTVVGTQGRLVVHLSDCMGNKCIEGGAHLEVSVNTNGAPKAALTCKCDDQQDGTFLVTWSSEVSHKYMLELKIHGVHIVGSPAPLTLLPGDLEVSRCSLLAPREAVAGVASLVETKCCDAYGNEVAPDVLAGHAPPFGLLLVPALLKGVSGPTGKDGRDVEEKRGPNKGDHVDEKRRAALLKKEERANLIKTLDTMSFHGSWDGSRMKMSFVPKEAGDFELHVWCEPNTLGVRQFLPGCPTMIHVKPGRASAIGSHVRSEARPSHCSPPATSSPLRSRSATSSTTLSPLHRRLI